MAKLWTSAIAALLCSLVSAAASAEVLWRGDYDSGDLSQWSKVQTVAADRLTVVPDSQGGTVLKATVLQGDNPIGASGNRNEVVYMSLEESGTERFYRWQTMFPEDYPSVDTWQLFTQFHHIGPNGSPPVQFYVRGEEIILSVDNQIVWTMPLVRGRWIDFIFHAKWSSDPTVGFVELYTDGQITLPKTPARTQFEGQVNYLKQGLYRDAGVAATATVYHDGMTIATELADVMPTALAKPSERAMGDDSAQSSLTSPEMTQEDFRQLQGQAGCSASPGLPMVPLALGLLGGLLRRRRATRRAARDSSNR